MISRIEIPKLAGKEYEVWRNEFEHWFWNEKQLRKQCIAA